MARQEDTLLPERRQQGGLAVAAPVGEGADAGIPALRLPGPLVLPGGPVPVVGLRRREDYRRAQAMVEGQLLADRLIEMGLPG